jgi:signal transduction histidine kinase
MTEIAERPPASEGKPLLAHWDIVFQRLRSPILRYAFSVASVVVAVALALTLQYYQFREVELPLLTLAIALTTWYAGNGPSVVAVLLSMAAFSFFFVEPIYSFYIYSTELPYLFVFVIWAVIVASFSAVRRRIEDNLVRAREELAIRAAELQATNKELEAFAYSVSHDLRAPLRHIAGYTELLQRHRSSLLDEKANRYIRIILESSKRMANLIDDLLAFSKLGRAEIQTTSVNLEQLAREATAEIGQDTAGRDIAWKIGPLPACRGDRAMLKIVLRNLVANAVKFTRMRMRAEIEIGYSKKPTIGSKYS